MRAWWAHIIVQLSILCAYSCGSSFDQDILWIEPGQEEMLFKADWTNEYKVELKIMVEPGQIDLVRGKFGLKKSMASKRYVYFYDTPDLQWYSTGLILRARKIIDNPDDSTVKFRPMTPDELNQDWLGTVGFKCEEDRGTQTSAFSCSLTTHQDRGEIDEVAEGQREIHKLFSQEQEQFITEFSQTTFLWENCSAFGPASAWKWKLKTNKLPEHLTFELWELPDGFELLEISTRVNADEAEDNFSDFEGYLSTKGIDTQGEQTSKTKACMLYFSAQ